MSFLTLHGKFMHDVALAYARAYNTRKKRINALWGDRYHATLVDRQDYLFRCLQYIDLNMVRAGVVQQPQGWKWCGCQEISGHRKRYRLINQEKLAEYAGACSLGRLKENYLSCIDTRLQ